MVARVSARPGLPPLLFFGACAVALGWAAGISPGLAVMAALGGAAATLVLASLSAGLCLFALVGVMDVLSKTGGSVSGTKALGLVLVLSWAAHIATKGRQHRGLLDASPVLGALLVGFLAWIALSMIWAPTVGVAATALMRFALNLALFPIVFSAVRTRRHAMWLAVALVTAGAVTVSYAMIKGGSALPTGEYQGSARLDLKGGIGDPNQLAAVLVVSVALAGTVFACLKGQPVLRLACLGAAAVSLAGIALTVSRGGLIALGVMVLAAIVFGGRWRPRILAASLIVATAVIAYFAVLAPATVTNRVTHAAGGSGRNELWSLGWRMAQDHPVLGVGAGGFPALTPQYLIAPGTSVDGTYHMVVTQAVVTHNTYLQILAELGLVGLLLFLGIIVTSLRSFAKAARLARKRGDVRLELLARGMLVALVGLLAADFFLSDQYGKSLWLLLAAGPAMLAVARRQPAESSAVVPASIAVVQLPPAGDADELHTRAGSTPVPELARKTPSLDLTRRWVTPELATTPGMATP